MEKLQFSAGGVVYRKTTAGIEIVILVRDGGKVFCLPKGKIEAPETPREAALREIREEPGLTGAIEEDLGPIKYRFYSEEEDVSVDKTVTFFLVRYISGSTDDHDADAEEVRWLPASEAIRIMTYPSERKIAKNAQDRLQKRT